MDIAESTKFTDTAGNVWDTKLTLAAARRIDDADLTAVGITGDFSVLNPPREFFTKVLTDTSVMATLVFLTISPQAKANGLPDADENYEEAELAFAELLDGETIERMRAAFWRAVSGFFPKQKTVLLTLMRKYQDAQTKIAAGLNKMDGRIGEVIDAEVDRELAELSHKLETFNSKRGET